MNCHFRSWRTDKEQTGALVSSSASTNNQRCTSDRVPDANRRLTAGIVSFSLMGFIWGHSMPTDDLPVLFDQWALNRERTLALLQTIRNLPDPAAALGWRPGPGRAHIGWQLAHIAITEELFATERFLGTTPDFPDLGPRFKGGSTPDDQIPSADDLTHWLEHSRQHLLATVKSLSNEQLQAVPPALQARNLTARKALSILTWHEPHHQGQAHITLNLFKAAHGLS